ncbi:MAG TPA: DUF481 domain-containing protein [Thermoanaerobaculales bacterium]|nr:DUF481 domain-containing protein [Thermoanaerobaculales bacterium]HQP43035.1 DUF481 domain-containing protein [Thermoanaerobaculales bacterium]
MASTRSRSVLGHARFAAAVVAHAFASWAMLTAFVAPASARDKVDVVVLANGDRVTGEIKTLERSVLQVKTDAMGTVDIEWEKVARVVSPQSFQVEDREGRRFYGLLSDAGEPRTLAVAGPSARQTIAHVDVVRIAAIDEVWTDRVKGSIDLGLDAKKAGDEASYTLGFNSSYRTPKFLSELDLESSITSLSDVPTTQYNDLTFQYSRFRKNRWFSVGSARFQTSSEQALDLRASLGGGLGRYVLQTNRSLSSVVGGLIATREWYAAEPGPQDNLEVVIAGDYEFFEFSPRKTDFTIDLSLYPSLTSWGRVRGYLGSSLRWELIKDFYFSLNLSVDYDSRPPQDSESTDWRFWTSLGYSF